LYNRDYANEIVYPNPFMDKTKIEFDVHQASEFSLSIFNAEGVEVRKLLYNNPVTVGKYQMNWDGKNGYGVDLPNGIYIYKLQNKLGSSSSGKIILRRN